MSEAEIRELRALIARVGMRQNEIASRLPCPPSTLSEYLSGKIRIPEATEAKLRVVVDDLAREMAEQERAAGEAKARALLEAAGITEDTAAPVAA